MSVPVVYPAVPLSGPDGETTGVVTIDTRTGAMTATVNDRPFVSRPPAGRRRSLDTGFIELRKVLRRDGYRLRSCGACSHFRYSVASREMSAGLSGYCGLGHHEVGPANFITTGPRATAMPIVTLYYGCPDWDGRAERDLAEFFARKGGESLRITGDHRRDAEAQGDVETTSECGLGVLRWVGSKRY